MCFLRCALSGIDRDAEWIVMINLSNAALNPDRVTIPSGFREVLGISVTGVQETAVK